MNLRQQAEQTAQEALRAAVEYQSKHGHRSALLDARYEAAERVVDAVTEYEDVDALLGNDDDRHRWDAEWAAEQLAPGVSFDLPLAVVPRTEDPGDHYAGMPS